MTTAAGVLARRLWNTVSTTPTQRYVRDVAARRLDDDRPDWYEHVNLASLDMSSHLDCLLGQVYGGYDRGLVVLYGAYHRFDAVTPGITAFAAGFPRRLWAVEVLARRHTAPPAPPPTPTSPLQEAHDVLVGRVRDLVETLR